MNFSKFTIAILVLFSTSHLIAQQKITAQRSSLKLEIQGIEGTNGSSVAYNLKEQLYYAAIAGNTSYPLETFDSKGNPLFSSEASNDLRGMWYNKKSKSLEANCYNDGGIVSIGLNSNSYAIGGNKILFNGKIQPEANSCGTLDVKKKEIIYYSFGHVVGYSLKNGQKGKINLKLEIPVLEDNLNTTNLVYTGVSKMEYGLLDFKNKKVLLFDSKTGVNTAEIELPSDAITNASFRFSFANEHVFLYDVNSRTWIGYKVF